MLKRLRTKFVCITMSIVLVMLCVIFGLLIHFTAQNLADQSIQLLYTISEEPLQPGRPGDRQVLLPYFILRRSVLGEIVISAGEPYFDLEDQDFLHQVLDAAMASETDIGVLEDYSLRYLRHADRLGQTFAFVDISSHRQTLRELAFTCAGIAAVCFAALLGISLLLARWAVKPVERAWAEQRQFVADASHELKTPLTVITTNAELLAAADDADPHRGQFIESIQAMAHQMRGLVEGLLELARVDNGAVRTAFAPVDLSEAVSSAVLPFEAVLFEAGLELDVQIGPQLTVMGSRQHICQVVEILLDNAAKYSAPHSPVWVSLQRTGPKECTLAVSGCGDPLSPEELKNIFKRFYRADKARSMNHSYGLGLSIAQTIVQDHGGKIWAQSAQGINSFFVRLPLIQ